MRDDFIQKNFTEQYDALLSVARFVASALTTQSLCDTTVTAATSLMKLESWLQYVALDCKGALNTKEMTLSPLVGDSGGPCDIVLTFCHLIPGTSCPG